MVAVGRMRKGTRLNKHEGSVIYLQAISGLWPGVIFCPTVVQTDGIIGVGWAG